MHGRSDGRYRSRSGLDLRDNTGQVILVFALLVPVFLALTAVAVGAGNWYTHAKHLQTKADAAALAGGSAWRIPCTSGIDTIIETAARDFAGPHTDDTLTRRTGPGYNGQVGLGSDLNNQADQIQVRLNADRWYDDDDPPNPLDFTTPTSPGGSLCAAMTLDVKVTETNSFPLASIVPLFPDIKRKARIEIQEGEVFDGPGLLPIAMRAPVPLSAAVYFNEANRNILAVKYFVRGTVGGLPPNLQGWTTSNPDEASVFSQFPPTSMVGVAIAISFRGACDTGLPNPNTLIPVQASGPCFEDQGFTTVDQLCNQAGTQIVNCYYATGTYPNENVQAGLHFIRGYADVTPGLSGPPAIEGAVLQNISCLTNSYFNWQRTPSSATDCQVRLSLTVDVGPLIGEYGPAGPAGNEPLHDEDIQVRFRLVRGDGSSQCNYGNQCDLNGGNGQGPTLTYRTTGANPSPDLILRSNSGANAVAIEIQIKNSTNHTNANCRGNGFSNNCRWYITGDGVFGTSVAPTDAQILAEPIQRSFRGNTLTASSVQFLRLIQDANCDNAGDTLDPNSASALADGCAGFHMEMGLKGGKALDADEPPIIFNDGIATSKTGILHCDPNVSNGQSPIQSIDNGCPPLYKPHSFDTSIFGNTLCPDQNDIFNVPNPGGVWSDWPPMTCVKTRSTGSANQIDRGFDRRFFDNEGAPCPLEPADGSYVKGRNYWNTAWNPVNAGNADPTRIYGFTDDTPARDANFHPDDPRLVTIFLVPTNFVVSNQDKTVPIAGFVQVYVTGYGRINGSGRLTNDDPCPGDQPALSEYDCQGSDCGNIAWGHIFNWVIVSPGGPTGNGELCAPTETLTPCVPVLVE
jgi:hypothetical protein